jgi:hypothetical protein
VAEEVLQVSMVLMTQVEEVEVQDVHESSRMHFLLPALLLRQQQPERHSKVDVLLGALVQRLRVGEEVQMEAQEQKKAEVEVEEREQRAFWMRRAEEAVLVPLEQVVVLAEKSPSPSLWMLLTRLMTAWTWVLEALCAGWQAAG